MKRISSALLGMSLMFALFWASVAFGSSGSDLFFLKTQNSIPLRVSIEISTGLTETVSATFDVLVDYESLTVISGTQFISNTVNVSAATVDLSDTDVVSISVGEIDTTSVEIIVPTPTPTSTPTNTPTPSFVEGIINRTANLRSGPGTSFTVAGSSTAGQKVVLIGQNADGTWYLLQTGEWIANFLVDNLSGSVPVITLTPTPTATRTPTPRPTATPTLTPTTTPTPDVVALGEAQSKYVNVLGIQGYGPFLFTAQRVEFWTEFPNGEQPVNDLFLAVEGTLAVNGGKTECLSSTQFELTIGGSTYDMVSVSSGVKQVFGRDYPGSFLGQCIDSGKKVGTFLLFDIPLDDGQPITVQFDDGTKLSLGESLATLVYEAFGITPNTNLSLRDNYQATYRASAVSPDIRELTRNTEQYVGTVVYYTGEVLQVIEDKAIFSDRVTYTIRLAVSGNFDQVVVAKLTYEGGMGLRPLEGDNIRIWGPVTGRESYQTVLGAQVVLPSVRVEILEIR